MTSSIEFAYNIITNEEDKYEVHHPERGTKYAAGFDLYSYGEYIIPPFEKKIIETRIRFQIPSTHF